MYSNYIIIIDYFCQFSGWHCTRPQPGRSAGLPVSRQRGAPAHPREKVVHGAGRDRSARRGPALWQYFHRDVLHFHVLLGIQDLLCLRFHAARWEYFFTLYQSFSLLLCLRFNFG